MVSRTLPSRSARTRTDRKASRRTSIRFSGAGRPTWRRITSAPEEGPRQGLDPAQSVPAGVGGEVGVEGGDQGQPARERPPANRPSQHRLGGAVDHVGAEVFEGPPGVPVQGEGDLGEPCVRAEDDPHGSEPPSSVGVACEGKLGGSDHQTPSGSGAPRYRFGHDVVTGLPTYPNGGLTPCLSGIQKGRSAPEPWSGSSDLMVFGFVMAPELNPPGTPAIWAADQDPGSFPLPPVPRGPAPLRGPAPPPRVRARSPVPAPGPSRRGRVGGR